MSARPIRALFGGDFWRSSSAADLAFGLRQCNWDIAQVDARNYLPRVSSVAGKLLNRGLERFYLSNYNAALLDQARKIRPDVFFTVKGVGLTGATAAALRDMQVFRVIYFPDVNLKQKMLSPQALSTFNLFVTTKSFQVDYIEKELRPDRVVFMPHIYSDAVERFAVAVDEHAKQWDVSYVGNASDHKFDLLLKVALAFPGLKMLIVGNGWSERAAGTVLASAIAGFPLTADLYARVAALSRISIGVHMGAAGSQGWEDLVSRRTFELPAYHGFMLHVDNAEVRELYRVPDEIDVFATADELVAKVRRYLPQPNLRQRMADAARARALQCYGATTRAAAIDRLVREKLSPPTRDQRTP